MDAGCDDKHLRRAMGYVHNTENALLPILLYIYFGRKEGAQGYSPMFEYGQGCSSLSWMETGAQGCCCTSPPAPAFPPLQRNSGLLYLQALPASQGTLEGPQAGPAKVPCKSSSWSSGLHASMSNCSIRPAAAAAAAAAYCVQHRSSAPACCLAMGLHNPEAYLWGAGGMLSHSSEAP
eukprot:1154344-Pelagomonas_calceolata.AAC.4